MQGQLGIDKGLSESRSCILQGCNGSVEGIDHSRLGIGDTHLRGKIGNSLLGLKQKPNLIDLEL